MAIIVYVLFIFHGFLLFSPTPPIHPSLPKPPRANLVHQARAQQQLDQTTPISQSQQNTDKRSAKEQHVLYTRVAARSLGEGAFALAEIACTIKNRLRVSHNSLAAVLRAYHAGDVVPKPADIEVVRQVFAGELPCPATWWYALSLQDSYTWQPHRRPPAKTVKLNERKQILIFDR